MRHRISFLIAVSLILSMCAQTQISGAASSSSEKRVSTYTKTAYQKLYNKAWTVLKDNYLHRHKLAHWQSWKHKFDGKLNSRKETLGAIEKMVDSLGDDYTYLLNEKSLKHRATERRSHQVVSARRLPNNVGYLSIRTFGSNHVANETQKALKSLRGVDAYVLDLRDNPGGLIDEAYEVFAQFVEEGVFTTYDGYQDGDRDTQAYYVYRGAGCLDNNGHRIWSKRRPNLTGRKPLIVLVNNDTKSAAEMLTGALHDGGRARVVGVRTFGKGVLQDTYELDERSSVKVVTAKYFLPGGTNIHNIGIEPDVIVSESENQLDRATSMLKTAIAEEQRRSSTVAGVAMPSSSL
jgi:C-terminal processing protease CtpA/Prc